MAKEKKDKENMSFLGHLEELRWRLVRISAVIVVFAIVFFIFTEEIMNYVLLAHKDADFITYRIFGKLGEMLGAGDSLYPDEIDLSLQSIKMMGQFGTHLFMSIVGGIVIAFPYIFFEIWGFVKPGLKSNEKKATRGITIYASLLFFLGILFGYYVVAPLTVQFFGNYQITDDIQNNFTIRSYLATVVTSTFLTGLFFQLPIVSYILSKIGLLTPQFLRKYRRHAVVVLLVLSAIITPPDIISQVIVVIPLMGLYEISIMVSNRIYKKHVENFGE